MERHSSDAWVWGEGCMRVSMLSGPTGERDGGAHNQFP